jgi:dTDP-4-amino-4,6-dideoxygalactose transaminase
MYTEALTGSVYRLNAESPDGTHTYHLFVVQTPDRQRVIDALNHAEIGFGIHYPEPVHLMDAYRFLGGRPGDLPVTEAACDSVISLPLYPGLPPEDVRRVVETLRAAV